MGISSMATQVHTDALHSGSAKRNVASGVVGMNIDRLAPHAIRKVASAEPRNTHDAEVGLNIGFWTLAKKITFTDGMQGSWRVYFDLRTQVAGWHAYGQIRRNGVVIGTIQDTILITYTTYEEDFVINLAQGDSLEIWYYNEGVLSYCLLYTSPSPRDGLLSRMPSSA